MPKDVRNLAFSAAFGAIILFVLEPWVGFNSEHVARLMFGINNGDRDFFLFSQYALNDWGGQVVLSSAMKLGELLGWGSVNALIWWTHLLTLVGALGVICLTLSFSRRALPLCFSAATFVALSIDYLEGTPAMPIAWALWPWMLVILASPKPSLPLIFGLSVLCNNFDWSALFIFLALPGAVLSLRHVRGDRPEIPSKPFLWLLIAPFINPAMGGHLLSYAEIIWTVRFDQSLIRPTLFGFLAPNFHEARSFAILLPVGLFAICLPQIKLTLFWRYLALVSFFFLLFSKETSFMFVCVWSVFVGAGTGLLLERLAKNSNAPPVDYEESNATDSTSIVPHVKIRQMLLVIIVLVLCITLKHSVCRSLELSSYSGLRLAEGFMPDTKAWLEMTKLESGRRVFCEPDYYWRCRYWELVVREHLGLSVEGQESWVWPRIKDSAGIDSPDFQDYQKVVNLNDGWLELWTEHDFQLAFVDRESALATLLPLLKRWTAVARGVESTSKLKGRKLLRGVVVMSGEDK